ncbi:MAG: type II toxin-antitoxin system RelE/ParE family toxin [Cyanobacteria bacterium P01_F01_bin.53]
MSYRIEFTKRANKQFQALPAQIQKRIAPKIDALAQEPSPQGVVKLSGEDNAYRIRVGDYRVVYNIEDDRLQILVFRVDHRRDVYR